VWTHLGFPLLQTALESLRIGQAYSEEIVLLGNNGGKEENDVAAWRGRFRRLSRLKPL
jgi:hypothetical protein